MTVCALVPRDRQISLESAELLEGYLERARSGEVVGVAIAAVMSDGSVVHEASSSNKQPALLGAVVRLLHLMNLNADDST